VEQIIVVIRLMIKIKSRLRAAFIMGKASYFRKKILKEAGVIIHGSTKGDWGNLYCCHQWGWKVHNRLGFQTK